MKDYERHIRVSHAWLDHMSWCGKNLEGFYLDGIDHAANCVMSGSWTQPCPECVRVVRSVLNGRLSLDDFINSLGAAFRPKTCLGIIGEGDPHGIEKSFHLSILHEAWGKPYLSSKVCFVNGSYVPPKRSFARDILHVYVFDVLMTDENAKHLKDIVPGSVCIFGAGDIPDFIKREAEWKRKFDEGEY